MTTAQLHSFFLRIKLQIK